jgi:dienelactone hydrolase
LPRARRNQPCCRTAEHGGVRDEFCMECLISSVLRPANTFEMGCHLRESLRRHDNKAAADLAWSRTLAFFAENLGAPAKGA